jgi:hypothetical protein
MFGLRFLNQILSIFSSHTMSSDPFVQFFTSPASMTTTTFLNHFKNIILLSESAPHHHDGVLNHFMVRTISLNKHTATTSQHEFLSINVYDTRSTKSHLVFLEQTMSSSALPSDSDSATAATTKPYHQVMRSFLRSLASSPSGLMQADQEVEAITLLPTTQSSDSLDSFTPSPTPSFKDAASLASAQVMCKSWDSLSGRKVAGDQFVMGQHPSQLYGGGQIMRQLRPDNLTFFQLITLAETVHNYDPLYTLFKRQCYWYANTIYRVIEQTHTFSERMSHEPEDPESSDLRIPPDIYLPPSAGRWRGLLVMAVSQVLVMEVRKKFEECFSESLVQIKGQWDRVNGGDIENAALRARISQLESELDRQANSST